ncbi:cytochrome c biogenesis CcdA family protein [Micromonospora sp. HM5-17]|jgi:cytochrome c-type biogenesis protein|uniref:cytochrome c biogenesis CcdA family protein n=1 Tax=Micromonospora sp. HM5-17 TaxID=2487710 RepID=UPI000F499491|nr:cytochrome c biogenesis protein CcdA [Micromonospora sp. HM5-17]ROT33887.1 cytochrome c biogenesis protein CcdA [Micromonospora sp. HM5-17]
MGETFADLARNGPLLLAIGAAALAGLVSFLSPCVLPLVPGYLSYVTGLAGSDLERRGAAGRVSSGAAPAGGPGGGTGGVAVVARPVIWGRVLAGTLLFIAGFTAVFTLTAVLVTALGQALFAQKRPLEIVIGAVIVLLGLAYLGLIPGMQREFRIQRLPAAGLLGAPVFGAVFALSWVPCVGPTLGAVLGMGTASGQADRAAVLAVAYCLGLGLPFVVFGLGFHRLLGLFRTVRRNSRWVTRVGGALLIVIGLALVTGGWQQVVIWLQTTVGVGEVSI